MPILVSPLSKVPDVIAARAPARLISLLDPESAFPSHAAYDENLHLRLGLHDVVEPLPHETAAQAEDVKRIIEFVVDWDREAPMLVHCWAGISRSTATAFLTACLHNPSAPEEEIAWALREASATATPNRRIVALADAELGRNGRMVKAIEAIGRGSPGWPQILEAAPFELKSRFGS